MSHTPGPTLMRLFTFAFFACYLALSGATAMAASSTAEGCDPDVETLHQSSGQAKMAGVTHIGNQNNDNKNDNTSAETCFNMLAGNDAGAGNTQYGGNILSGDFSTNTGYQSAISDGLSAIYSNFPDGDGYDSGMVLYPTGAAANPTPSAGAPCGQIEDSSGTTSGLWTRIKLQGIYQGAPSVTSITSLLSGAVPQGQSTTGSNNWANSKGTDQDFGQYNTIMTTVINKRTPLMNTTFTTVNGTNTVDPFCQVLQDAKVPNPACLANGQ
jgi:hypothetical protein